MKVAVGLRRVAAGKRTSGRRAAQIATNPLTFLVKYYSPGKVAFLPFFSQYVKNQQSLGC